MPRYYLLILIFDWHNVIWDIRLCNQIVISPQMSESKFLILPCYTALILTSMWPWNWMQSGRTTIHRFALLLLKWKTQCPLLGHTSTTVLWTGTCVSGLQPRFVTKPSKRFRRGNFDFRKLNDIFIYLYWYSKSILQQQIDWKKSKL